MQYKIPQNVQIEDKIVGPLTMKQLIILAVGGGLAYLTYLILAQKYFIEIWLPPVAVITLLTLAFTFLKINGITFPKWILLFIEYNLNGKKRTYQMGTADHYEATIFAKEQKKKQNDFAEKSKAQRDKEKLQNISEISATLDSYGTPAKPTA